MVSQWWISVLVGCVLGFLSGLGVGGGSLLMLWLTAVAGTDPSHARILNLLFFLPCALIASFFRLRQTRPDRRLLLAAMTGGLLGALGGNLLRGLLSPELLKKALGMLFLICGFRELFYRPKELR